MAEIVSAPGNGSLTLNANGSFIYKPNANFNGADSFTYGASDGKANSAPASVALNINPVNDAPVNRVPGALSTIENHPISFGAAHGNALSVSDVDVGSGFMRLTLAAINVTITLAGTGDLSFSVGDGAADSTMTFTGRIASIDNALDGLSFMPTNAFSGTSGLQISTNDLGNSGSGGAFSDTDTRTGAARGGGLRSGRSAGGEQRVRRHAVLRLSAP